MRIQTPGWPRTSGSSLLLIPLTYRKPDWADAERVIGTAIDQLDIAVARGLSHCSSCVRAGAEGLVGAAADDVLAFACPADIGLFEAAPLVTAAETGVMLREVAEFFREATEAALTLATRIAWVVAHDWSPGDRVRWDAGDVEKLVRFATSRGAWRTTFLASRPDEVYESDEWPYWFQVTSRAL